MATRFPRVRSNPDRSPEQEAQRRADVARRRAAFEAALAADPKAFKAIAISRSSHHLEKRLALIVWMEEEIRELTIAVEEQSSLGMIDAIADLLGCVAVFSHTLTRYRDAGPMWAASQRKRRRPPLPGLDRLLRIVSDMKKEREGDVDRV